MGINEIGVNTRNWVDSGQDRDYWIPLVNASLNITVSLGELSILKERPSFLNQSLEVP